MDAQYRAEWLDRIEAIGAVGLRMLTFAAKRGAADASPYEALCFLGALGLPRADVPEATRACREAGVRVAMVTGDHAVTARYRTSDWFERTRCQSRSLHGVHPPDELETGAIERVDIDGDVEVNLPQSLGYIAGELANAGLARRERPEHSVSLALVLIAEQSRRLLISYSTGHGTPAEGAPLHDKSLVDSSRAPART